MSSGLQVMRNAISVMLLVLVSGGAAAQWVRTGSHEFTIAYADAATIRMSEVAMREASLAMLLARVSRVAEWMHVGHSDSLSFYIDLTTINKAGNTAKMWHLIDFKKPDKVRLGMSITANSEYDCQERRVRQIFASSHSGNMGGDEVVFSNSDVGKWEPVSPDSITSMKAILWRIACGKQ